MKEVKLNELNIYDIGSIIQISGAVFSGNNKIYLCMFPKEQENIEGSEIELLKMDDRDWEKFLKQTDLLEVEIVNSDTNAKSILRKSQRQIDANVTWNVFRRDKYKCRYCGRDDVPLTVDHIVLWEKGGATVEKNLNTSCKRCNKERGNMEYEAWLNSAKYKVVSMNLDPLTKAWNMSIISEIPNIQLIKNIRSR